MQSKSFAQAGGFFIEEMDGEVLLYKTGTHKAVYLNETAALVWKLCDGERTVGDIAKLLADSFPNCGTLEQDVQKAMETLLREGVISARS
jgi:pyrroloquinoline quinone biosynthesis protein D